MPWLKIGDDAAKHPRLMAVYEHEEFDDRLVNEVFGFFIRCATASAGFLTDYIITRGMAIDLAGQTRANQLLHICQFAGLMQRVDVDDREAFKIVDDDPDFVHLRLKEEVEFERQRKQDNSDPSLVIPVRLRDGDACRYCGQVVKFGARRGRLAGTYDHRVPGQAATVDTMVVACSRCNAARGNDPEADQKYPLLPVPSPPYYEKSTIEWINNHEWARSNHIQLPQKKTRFVPAGAVPPGHQEHVKQPELNFAQGCDSDDGQSTDVGGQGRVDRGVARQPDVHVPRTHETGCDQSPTPPTDAGVSHSTSFGADGRVDRGVAHQPDAHVPRTHPEAQADVGGQGRVDRGVARQPDVHVPRTHETGCDQSPNHHTSAAVVDRGVAHQPDAHVPRTTNRAEVSDSPYPSKHLETPLPAQTPVLQKLADPAETQCESSRNSGTGRGGSGRLGKGGAGKGRPGAPPGYRLAGHLSGDVYLECLQCGFPPALCDCPDGGSDRSRRKRR